MSAAWELAALGVTANIVHPPVTDTGGSPMTCVGTWPNGPI